MKISFYFGYKIVNLKYNGLKFGHPKTIDPFLSKNKKLFIQHLRVRMSKIGAVVKISFYFGYKIVNLKYNGLKFGHPKTIDPFLSKNKKLFIQHLRVRMSIVPV